MELMDCAPGVDARPSAPDLILRLRSATAAAHARLETHLALIEPLATRAHFTAVLEGFFGFHQSWERAMARRAELEPLRRGRGRIAALQADLSALGLTAEEIATVPICPAAAALAATPASALGSLYVMEGSTLGGQVIGRALKAAPWAPPGGLGYFTPYGAATGAMWRTFCEGLEARGDELDAAGVERGAIATFALLADWLPGRGAP